MRFRSTLTTVAAVVAAGVAAAPASADTVPVCNEAENSHRGGYTVAGGIVDPNPPAFLRGSQMRLGNGHGEGLLNAAQRSPALRECGVPVEVPPVDPDDGWGSGGDGNS